MIWGFSFLRDPMDICKDDYVYIYMLYMLYIYMYIYAIYIYDDDILYTLCVLGIPTVSSKGKFVGRALVDVLTTPSRHALIVASRNEAQTNGGFRENGGSQKRCLKRENPTYMDDLGVPLFSNHVKDCQKMNTLTCRVGCETATSATATESG